MDNLFSFVSNIICISDEAHRSQLNLDQKLVIDNKNGEVRTTYGYAKYLHDSLPNATYIGYTGTPIDETIDVLFKNREERLRKKYSRRIFKDDPLSERVESLVDVQSENGYMAEFNEPDEDEKDTITFEQYNCPIAAIADRYDKPCHYELELFKEVLGTDRVERVECIAKGGKSCKYIIQKNIENKL